MGRSAVSSTVTISGTKLISLRESKFLSRNDLAQRADLAISAIQRIEQGGAMGVRPKTIRKLSAGLGMNIDEMVAALSPGEATLASKLRQLDAVVEITGLTPAQIMEHFANRGVVQSYFNADKAKKRAARATARG